MKHLLIIGIDPGTTLAYAVLDLDGNLVKVDSSKQLNIDSLTANIFCMGKPLVIATDVKPIPKFIDKFASQIGAKVIGPTQNIKVIHKKRLVKGYDFSNDHERDALAAAVFAFKSVRKLLDKIERYVKKEKKEELRKKIIQLVFLKNISISEAVKLLEKKEVKPKIKKPKLRTESIKVKFDEVKYLKNQNENLNNKIKYLESKFKGLKSNLNKISDRKAKALVGFREKKINFLSKNIKEHKVKIGKLNRKLISFNDLFLFGCNTPELCSGCFLNSVFFSFVYEC